MVRSIGQAPPVRAPRDLQELYEELQELLALRQHPAVELILRGRFVAAVLACDGSAWAGYGFEVAHDLAASLRDADLRAIDLRETEALVETLDLAGERPAPALPGAETWVGDNRLARERLRENREARRALLDGRPAAPVERRGSSGSRGTARVLIPVVAHVRGAGDLHPLYAGVQVSQLARLEVRVDIGRFKDDLPILQFSGEISQGTQDAFHRAMLATARFGSSGDAPVRHCRFSVTCDAGGGRLVGNSGTLGFLLAAAAARASLSLRPIECSLAPELAVTGDLDGTRVLAVDPGSIAGKVRACFEGPAGLFLVPRDQETAAQAELARLKEAHPGRDLRIAPAGSALEIWRSKDLGVLRRARSPRRIWGNLSDRIRQSPARWAAVGVGAALLMAGFGIWREVTTYDPVGASWAGDELHLYNAYGVRCAEIHLPYQPRGHDSPASARTHVVDDLDGDGKRDVLAVHASSRSRRDLLSLVGSRGRILWQRNATHVGRSKADDLSDVGWSDLTVLRAVEEPPGSLLAVRRSHQGNTSLVDWIDLTSGRTLGVLHNHGHIENTQTVDVDLEPGDEVVLVGVDQRTGWGLVVVLDMERLNAGPEPQALEAVVDVSDPGALDRGVRAAWIFPNDRFLQPVRGSVGLITKVSDGEIQVTCDAGRNGAVIYDLDSSDPRRPRVRGAILSDAARAVFLAGGVSPADILKREEKLAGDVRSLGSDGWQPAELISSESPGAGR